MIFSALQQQPVYQPASQQQYQQCRDAAISSRYTIIMDAFPGSAGLWTLLLAADPRTHTYTNSHKNTGRAKFAGLSKVQFSGQAPATKTKSKTFFLSRLEEEQIFLQFSLPAIADDCFSCKLIFSNCWVLPGSFPLTKLPARTSRPRCGLRAVIKYLPLLCQLVSCSATVDQIDWETRVNPFLPKMRLVRFSNSLLTMAMKYWGKALSFSF